MLRSRKFWALVTSIVAAAAGLATNQIDTWQFIIVVVAAMAAYSTGVAIEDAGTKAGAANTLQLPAQTPPVEQPYPTPAISPVLEGDPLARDSIQGNG